MIAKLYKKVLTDSHLLELFRGSWKAFSIRVLGLGSGYIFTYMVTKFYGAGAMGIFSLSFTLMLIASQVVRLGMDTALLRFVAEFTARNDGGMIRQIYLKVLAILIPFGLAVTLGVLILSPLLAATVFKKPYLAPYFQVAALGIFPLGLLFTHAECLRGIKRIFAYSFFRNMSVAALAAILLYVFHFFGHGPVIPVIAYVVSITSLSILAFFLWGKFSGIYRPQASGNNPKPSILKVSLPMFLSSSMLLLMKWIDTIMLGMFRSEADVGLYYVAVRITNITALTIFAVTSIAAPKLAEFFSRRDNEGLKRFALQSTRLMFWATFPLLAGLALFPKAILTIFGSEFSSASLALLFLLSGQLIHAMGGVVGHVLNMTGHEKTVKNILICAVVINIVLNFLLIPGYGINGAAIASVFSVLFWNVAMIFQVREKFGFWNFYIPILKRGTVR